jgi:hypothetical protein
VGEDYAAVQAARGGVVTSIRENLQRERGERAGEPRGGDIMGKGCVEGEDARACRGVIEIRGVEALWK